jgi:hypothetical protein
MIFKVCTSKECLTESICPKRDIHGKTTVQGYAKVAGILYRGVTDGSP